MKEEKKNKFTSQLRQHFNISRLMNWWENKSKKTRDKDHNNEISNNRYTFVHIYNYTPTHKNNNKQATLINKTTKETKRTTTHNTKETKITAKIAFSSALAFTIIKD